MGSVKKHPAVKLIAGFIFKEGQQLECALRLLVKKFGPTDFLSPAIAFNHTAYYEKEFGKNLIRVFVSFKKLIRPEHLPAIKLATNKIEHRLSKNSSRTINIDPGYLESGKLVLATTKDYAHRIYAGLGIFQEVTLSYQGKSFRHCEWTYPDYRTLEYITVFNQIRNIYLQQLKST